MTFVNKTGGVRITLTLRRVRAIICAVEKHYYIFWVCVWSLMYPACNAHAPYCRLWSVWPYHIFLPYLINGTIFEKKKLLNIKCVFWFSPHLLPKTFPIKGELGEMLLKICIFLCVKCPLCLPDFNENWISLKVFSKNTSIKYHENTSNLDRIVPLGRTDRRTDRQTDRGTDMTKLIVVFRNFSNAPKKQLK